MSTPKLILVPMQESYLGVIGNNSLSNKLNGPMGAYRFNNFNNVHKVSVLYKINGAAYNYLMAFYRTAICFGSLPFLSDLKIQKTDIEEYLVKLIPNTFKLTSVSDCYVVNAELEVLPNAVEDDQTTIDSWSN
jgi:hypothetical protein